MKHRTTFVQMPVWEISLCASLWIFLALRGCYAVLEASHDYQHYVAYALDEGSSLFGNSKDVTDSEWTLWHQVMRDGFYKWLIAHIFLGQLIIYFGIQKYRAVAFAVYGLIAVINLIGWHSVLMAVAHTTVLCSVACFTASPLCVWIISILFLLSFNVFFTQELMIDYNIILESGSMLPEYAICMSLVRSTSAALCICDIGSVSFSDRSNGENDNETAEHRKHTLANGCQRPAALWKRLTINDVVDILCYVWYLPLFLAGPLMTCENFCRQFNVQLKPLTWVQCSPLLGLAVRVVFWAFVFEIIIHFIYASALLNNIETMRLMSVWAVAGVGYVQGQLFMVKYFVVFGGFGALSQLDQLYTAGPPRCISYIYRYSQMWQSFDRGLYHIMLRHIYVPLGGSRHGQVRRLFASLMCFAYVCLWHGMSSNVLFWVVANFIGISLEAFGDQLASSAHIRQLEARFLSPVMTQRLHSLCTVPLTALSAFAIFTFFTNTTIGYLIFHRLIVAGFPTSTPFIIVSVYAFIQTSKEITRRQEKLKSS